MILMLTFKKGNLFNPINSIVKYSWKTLGTVNVTEEIETNNAEDRVIQ